MKNLEHFFITFFVIMLLIGAFGTCVANAFTDEACNNFPNCYCKVENNKLTVDCREPAVQVIDCAKLKELCES